MHHQLSHRSESTTSEHLTSIILRILILSVLAIFVGCSGSTEGDMTGNQPERIATYDCTICPEFSDKKDTLEYINEVRRFIAERADAGKLKNSFCEGFETIALDTFPVQTFLHQFQKDSGVASARLCAHLMVKILLANGLDAYNYTFSPRESDVAHSVVLVKHNSELWITDPRVNYTLLELDGDPMDLFKLIEMTGQGNLKYATSQDTVEGDMLFDYKLIRGAYADRLRNDAACKAFIQEQKFVRDSITKIKTKRCYACERERDCFSLINRMEEELRRTTGLTDYHEALALPNAWIQGADDEQEIADRIEAHIYRQPNLGKRVSTKKLNK